MHKCAWNTEHTQGMETFAKLCSLLRKTETLRNCDCKDGDFRWNLSHLVLYYASTQILIKREQSPKLNKQLDGKFKRCRNFVTITAGVYHLLLKRQIPLAVMEAEQESSENIALFWSLFNEGLQKVTGDERVYLILKVCAPTRLELTWMDFGKFLVIHAGRAHKAPSNLSLLDAAHTDARDSVLLAVELLNAVEQETSKGGTGPSYDERKTKLHHRKLGRTARLGQEIVRIALENGLLVDPNSRHRPPENKTTRKRKQHKRTEVQSTRVQALPGTSSSSLQQQDSNNSGFSLEPTQLPDRATAQQTTLASIQSTDVHPHSNSMTLNQRRCLPTTSHHMELPAAIIMGRSYHGVSPREILHHHSPVIAGGCLVQQHDPLSTGQNYPQPTYDSGAESWHSRYSPHRYELVTLPGNVKTCYGCGAEFTERYRSPSHNIVVKHIDRRLVRWDKRTGTFLFSADYSNTYYRLNFAHIQRENPFFNGLVFIAFDKLNCFDNS